MTSKWKNRSIRESDIRDSAAVLRCLLQVRFFQSVPSRKLKTFHGHWAIATVVGKNKNGFL